MTHSVCDWADGNKTQDKDDRQRLAAHNAANFVLHVLQQAPLKQKGKPRTGVVSAIPSNKTDIAQVTLLLNKEMHEFTPDEQASFVFALARIIDVAPDQIKILRVVQGSVLVTLQMPEEAALMLLSLFRNKDVALQPLQITKVELKQQSVENKQEQPTQTRTEFLGSDVVAEKKQKSIEISGGVAQGIIGADEVTVQNLNINLPFDLPFELRQSMIEELQKRLSESLQRQKRQAEMITGLRPRSALNFLDRFQELTELRQLISQSQIRFIIIIGRAGMGKTALVAHLLDEIEEQLLQQTQSSQPTTLSGIMCVSARGGDLSLDDLYNYAQRLLGGQAAKDITNLWRDASNFQTKSNILLDFLRRGHYLIIIDNLEDCLTPEFEISDPGLEAFFTACLTTKDPPLILITSRHPPELRQGRVWVKYLKLDDGLPEDKAVEFLRQWDTAGLANLKTADHTILRELVRRVAGIPRALEYIYNLLATDVTLTPEELLNEDKLWQKEVLQALQDESYNRLSDPVARRLLEILAIFGRPVPLAALQFVAQSELDNQQFSTESVKSILGRLVRHAFVSYDQPTKTYNLHPLDAKYLNINLTSKDKTALHMRVADYYAYLCLPKLHWISIGDIEPQIAEFEHLVASGQFEKAALLLDEDSLDLDYLIKWGHAERVKELRELLIGNLKSNGLQIANLYKLGRAYYFLGQEQRAIQKYEQALEIARRTQDKLTESIILSNLAKSYRRLGQANKAVKLSERALDIIRNSGDKKREGNELGNLSNAYYDLGQVEKAISLSEEALTISKDVGDLIGEGYALDNLGVYYHTLGENEKAIDFLREALAISQQVNDRYGEGNRLGSLGQVYADLGQVDKAKEYYQQAVKIHQETGNRRSEAIFSWHLGEIYEQNDTARAVTLMSVRVDYLSEIGHSDAEAVALRVSNIRAILQEKPKI